MKLKIRKVIAGSVSILVLVGCLLSFVGSGYVYAAGSGGFEEEKAEISILESKLDMMRKNTKRANEAYEEAVKAYEGAELDVKQAKEYKESLDKQVTALNEEIEASRTLLDIYKTELEKLSTDISEKEKEIEERRTVFLDRMRSNYEDSFTSYLELLLDAENFSDFLYRLDVVASMMDYDKRVLSSLENAKKSLEDMQSEKQHLQVNQQKTFETLSEQLPVLEERQRESEAAVNRYNEALRAALENKELSEEAKQAAIDEYIAVQEELDAAEQALQKKIREEQERLRKEEEERKRKEEEERKKREEEERKKKEEEERKKKEEEERKKKEEESRKLEQQGQEPVVTEEPVTTEAVTEEPEPPKQEEPKQQGTTGGIYGEQGDDDYVGGSFIWPVDQKYSRITSTFGYRPNPFTGRQELHNGIDIPCNACANIYASNSGTVIVADYHYSYGNYVVIDHGNGIATLYAHNTRLCVSVGQKVKQGDVIALAGTTGDSQGNHCHFSVRVNGVPVDPLKGYVTQP